MYSVYFDIGTTNTRAYLLHDLRLVASRDQPVGVRASAAQGSNRSVVASVRSLYAQVLATHCLADDDIAHVCMSGMASSPGGLHEVLHLDAPVSLTTVRDGLVPYRDPDVLPSTIWFVPGVRALPHRTGQLSPGDAVDAQIMRGEETEIFGILDTGAGDDCHLVVLPGSHTQTAIVQDDAIVDLFSTVTGELRGAVLEHTILRSALGGDPPEHLDPDFVQLGYRTLARSGFNHALYAVRALELFSDTTSDQRHAYFQGVLTGGVLDGTLGRLRQTGREAKSLVVAGRRSEYDAYAAIAAVADPRMTVTHRPADDVPYSVRGYCRIARDNPLLARS